MSLLPPADDPATNEVFAQIAQSRGWVSNLLRSLAHSPKGLAALQQVGHFGRYESDLSERERELAIVITGRNVPYAWAHHAPLAEQIGIDASQLESIKADKVPAGLSPAEAALSAYCFEFTAAQGISDACFSGLKEHYSSRQITDVSILCAYYMAAGALLIGLRVEIEPKDMLRVELEWQKKKLAEAGA